MKTENTSKKTVCRVLTGPTASGKTEIGIRLAKEMGWEILCMDSMQIYRRMNIGTAKPTAEEMQGVPHYLLDLCEPTDSYSVSDYREAAEKKIGELAALGRETLFVGGTALYLQAMMHPMGMGQVSANPELREELNRLAETPEGKRILHERLSRLDPVTAERLPLNDVRRTIRAIEVSEATGIPFSMQPNREVPTAYEWKVVSTAMERTHLYERINERVTGMIRAGLKEEVAALLAEGVPEEAQSMQGLGYKEMIPYLRGEQTLDQAVESIQKGTRHYAKRQETFLRRLPEVRFLDAFSPDLPEQLEELLCGDPAKE